GAHGGHREGRSRAFNTKHTEHTKKAERKTSLFKWKVGRPRVRPVAPKVGGIAHLLLRELSLFFVCSVCFVLKAFRLRFSPCAPCQALWPLPFRPPTRSGSINRLPLGLHHRR